MKPILKKRIDNMTLAELNVYEKLKREFECLSVSEEEFKPGFVKYINCIIYKDSEEHLYILKKIKQLKNEK